MSLISLSVTFSVAFAIYFTARYYLSQELKVTPSSVSVAITSIPRS